MIVNIYIYITFTKSNPLECEPSDLEHHFTNATVSNVIFHKCTKSKSFKMTI